LQKITHQIHSFDGFTLDLTRGCLLGEGEEIRLRPQAFETLKFLVENSGRLISKDELIKAVWPDWNASDNQLARCLSEVRQALGDDEQHYIKTVPRRGYIFDAQVSEDNTTKTGHVYTEQIDGVKVVIEEEAYEQGESLRARSIRQPDILPAHLHRWRPGPKIFTITALGVVLLSVVAYFLFSRPNRVEPTAKQSQTIAVLPFKPMNQTGQDEFLELGMADALITKLSNLRQIVVRPTSAVRKYAALEQDPVAAGRELKVASVLEGSVQRLDDRIRVTVQLVSVEDGTPLWAEKFDEKFANIFAVQDSISEKIAERLALKLTGEELRRLTKRYTDNIEAYQLYLKGRYFWEMRTEEAMKKSVGYFEQAIQIDPNYALAYAGIAHSYTALRARGYVAPLEGAQKMKEAVTKALELDDNLAEAHTAMGTYKITEFDWPGAEREFKRAIELDPNYPTAHLWYGFFLEGMGRQDENIAERKRALELDPLNLEINASLGSAYFYAGQYDKAIEQEGKALELNSNFQVAHQYLGRIYMTKGMYDEAISEFQKSGLKGSLGHAYAVSGRRAEAQKTLAELIEASKYRYISPLDIAQIYAGLEEKDQAFQWLEKAYQEHVTSLLFLKVDKSFSSLHSDARFQNLLQRVGFAP
jgi:TolB-like protein/DNA-binding winged helix-turn-helix (wHTH) protein/Tfp pilus assembly protein PilF